MTGALFVSDLHIGAPDDPRARAFARFLDACASDLPSHLVLVGDVFDLWIADRAYFVNRYAGLIARVRALVAAGTAVHYFEGNHDLDLARFWTRELGVTVHPGPTTFELYGRRVRVEHGDQMDPRDRGYHALRWLLRTAPVRGLGRRLPDRVLRWIGERMSRASRRYTSEVRVTNDEGARTLVRAHVRRLLVRERFDVFVSGHVHVAMDEDVAGVRAINLGTWLGTPMVLFVGADGVTLRKMNY